MTATFQPAGVTVLVPGDGTLDVPWEATETALDAAKGRIVFEGVTDGRVLISTDIPYAVGSHSDTEGSNSQPPTPSQWEQFVDEVRADADRAEQAAKDAEATLQDVKDAGAQAVTDIGNAKDNALEAIDAAREEAVGSISADVEGAKQAAADAEQSAADAEQSAKNAADALANVQAAGKSALDDIATERQNTLSDIQNEGAKQQSAVAGAGTAALEAIGQTEQAAINQIKQTGATQVGAVQSAGTTQVGLVNSAGQQQTENIAQAGSQQVQAVQTAGTAAVGTVNDARDEAVEEIETANAHSPQINQDTGYWQTWDAETGQYVDTTAPYRGPEGPQGDPGPTGPEGPPYTLTEEDKQTIVQAVIAALPDGDAVSYGAPEPGVVTTDNQYYTAIAAAIRQKLGTSTEYQPAQMAAAIESIGVTSGIPVTFNGNPVVATDTVVDQPFAGLKIYGKSTQTSSQLLPLTESSYSANGLTATLQDDGSLIINGTPGSSFTNLIYIPLSLSPGDYYIAGGENTSGRVVAFIEIKKSTGTNYFANQSFSVDGTETSIVFTLQSNFANAINNYRVPAMLNKGTKPLPVQKYNGTPSPENPIPIVSAGASGSITLSITDGADQSQSLTISTPNGMPGIPVSSGGNFTDSTGQRLACDYVDFSTSQIESMVLIWQYAEQTIKINKSVSGGTEFVIADKDIPGGIVKKGMSNKFTYESGESLNTFSSGFGQIWFRLPGSLTVDDAKSAVEGAYFVLQREAPITSPLSAEEIAAYNVLRSYANTTVISTAEPVATMEATVYCDAGATIQRLQGEIQTLSDATALNTQTLNTMLGAE